MAELPLERDRLCLAGVGAAAVLQTTSDFDAEWVLRLRVGFASDCRLASAETGAAGVATWASDAVLRTTATFLCQRGTLLRIAGGGQRMIPPQPQRFRYSFRLKPCCLLMWRSSIFPYSRNPSKPHSRAVQIAALAQRE